MQLHGNHHLRHTEHDRETAEIAAGLGLRIVGWDADTHDWRGDDAAAMLGDQTHWDPVRTPGTGRRRDRS